MYGNSPGRAFLPPFYPMQPTPKTFHTCETVKGFMYTCGRHHDADQHMEGRHVVHGVDSIQTHPLPHSSAICIRTRHLTKSDDPRPPIRASRLHDQRTESPSVHASSNSNVYSYAMQAPGFRNRTRIFHGLPVYRTPDMTAAPRLTEQFVTDDLFDLSAECIYRTL